MDKKVILVTVGGMRPDSLEECRNPYAQEFIKSSTSCLRATAVMPTTSLPCLMSVFHSVEPSRHNIVLDDYRPQVRPIMGIIERVKDSGKCAGMVYNWEPLRDLSRPRNVEFSLLFSNKNGTLAANRTVAEGAVWALKEYNPDFIFVHMQAADTAGHKRGWMSVEYLEAVSDSWDCIRRIAEAAEKEYQLIVTSDHGGHARMHGTDCEEDIMVPILLHGSEFEPETVIEGASILDIAPTVSDLMGFDNSPEWTGRSLVCKVK